MSPSEDARRAGRGLVSIAGAKGYFVLTSYAVQLLLPRIFGEAKEFGLYSATMSGVAILTNVLIVATIQSVSKFTSEDEKKAEATLRQGLRIQALVGGVLALSLFVSAPGLARMLLDDQLTPLFRIASVVVFAYALYGAVVGSLNGRHLFGKQARLDATFSTLRTAGILGGAAVGLGAIGAVAGFATAATGWRRRCRSIATSVGDLRQIPRPDQGKQHGDGAQHHRHRAEHGQAGLVAAFGAIQGIDAEQGLLAVGEIVESGQDILFCRRDETAGRDAAGRAPARFAGGLDRADTGRAGGRQ